LLKVIISLLFSIYLAVGKTLEVPFVKQQSEFCGPAALSSVLRYYGVNITQNQIGKSVYIPELNGALITDLENYAKKFGFKTKIEKGSIEVLKGFIKKDIPIIVLVDYGIFFVSRLHYVVVVGFNEKGFIIHTGYEKSKFISYKKFEKLWKKAGNIYLVVFK